MKTRRKCEKLNVDKLKILHAIHQLIENRGCLMLLINNEDYKKFAKRFKVSVSVTEMQPIVAIQKM